MSGLKVVTPPGFLASLRGVPYCPEQAIAKLSEPGYSGRQRAGSSGLSGRQPGRHRDRRPPAPAAGRSTPRARSTSPVPTKARRSASWSSFPRCRAPTTSATSRCGPRPTSTHHGPDHDRLRPAAADPRRDSAATALDPGQSRPARASRSIRPTAIRSRSTARCLGDEGGAGDSTRLLPGRQLRGARLRAEAQLKLTGARPSDAATRRSRRC